MFLYVRLPFKISFAINFFIVSHFYCLRLFLLSALGIYCYSIAYVDSGLDISNSFINVFNVQLSSVMSSSTSAPGHLFAYLIFVALTEFIKTNLLSYLYVTTVLWEV